MHARLAEASALRGFLAEPKLGSKGAEHFGQHTLLE